MMPIRRPILLVLIWLLFASFGALWIWQSLKATLLVENQSKDDFTDVTIVVADSLIWTGSIGAGTKIRRTFFPDNDSVFAVEGKWQGRKVSSSMGYTTVHDQLVHTITLNSDGELRYAVTP